MNIALVAHDNKKELMVSFCIAYKGILSKHNLFATGSTGDHIKEETGLNITVFSPGLLGGSRQLDSRIICGEIDMLIYFTNTLPGGDDAYADEGQIFAHCDMHDVAFATNIATAEVLIHGLDRGDLDWRELIKDM